MVSATIGPAMLQPQVIAAVIAALVSAIAAAIALLGSRWQLRGKLLELELKKQEIVGAAQTKLIELDLKRDELHRAAVKLQADAEALRQTLMRDVLAKRMAAYAEMWRVFITYERNWLLEAKPLDLNWARTFLLELNACNANHGVFFSEHVYVPFFEYRQRLVELFKQAERGHPITPDHVLLLTEISTTGTPQLKSLAMAMKDDLGSYRNVALQRAE